MIRVYWRLIASLMLVFCGVIGAIVAQPYDDGGLATQLVPEDCAPPCFLGIRPGVTTRAEALRLLRAHPWVKYPAATDDGRLIFWVWSGEQPSFLHTEVILSRISLERSIVRSITLALSADTAAFRIVFGAPDVTYFTSGQARDESNQSYTYFTQYVVYNDYQFEAVASGRCPLTTRELWQRPLVLTLPPAPEYADFPALVSRAFAPLPETCR